mgnify:FL=1|tara:strand:- start:1511 stop:1750 length:240 start_codon:yes stop_codon:yes gene_type:complete
MITVKILKPLWKNGGSVGIDERKFNKEGVLVEIDYKDKYGQKIYPHTYKFSKEKADSAEKMIWKKTTLKVIPIKEMEIM